MLVNFGFGKCPLCGDFGKEFEKSTFHCHKCRIAFNEFFITGPDEISKYATKFWN